MGFSFKIESTAEKKTSAAPRPQQLLPFQQNSHDDGRQPAPQKLFGIGENGEMEVDSQDSTTKKPVIIACKNRLRSPPRAEPGSKELDLSKPGLLIPKKTSSLPHCDSKSKATETSQSCALPTLEFAQLVHGEDREAAEALLKETQNEPSSQKPIEPILSRNNVLLEIRKNAANDTDLFRKEVELLPENQLSQYDRVPIEQFGLAMLCGMGYDPTKHVTKATEFKRKAYNRSGLGADEQMGKIVEAAKQAKNKPTEKTPVKTNGNVVDSGSKTEKPQSRSKNVAIDRMKDSWMSEGLIVKITNSSHRHFKRKGVIISVNREDESLKPTCSINLDPLKSSSDGVTESVVVRGVVEKDLETVISVKSSRVRIVGKTHKNLIGQTVEVKDVDVSKDRVEVLGLKNDEQERFTTLVLALDDVCEYRYL